MKLSKEKTVLPGFVPTLGFTVFYLSILVLIPLSLLFVKSAGLSASAFWQTITAPRVLAAYGLSFSTSLIAALINSVFGLLIAWILVRYRFWGRGAVDMLIDLPFALPTAVAGIALTTVFSPSGILGRLLDPLGIHVAFTSLGITVALIFIGLPFVVRAVQPVLQDLEKDMEEAATCLGAGRGQIFLHVVLPNIFPAVLSGFAMAFARALGEYGSVVFIAGNLPMKTEIAPLLIMTKLEQYDYEGAAAIAVVMLVVSFLSLWLVNRLQWWTHTRHKRKLS